MISYLEYLNAPTKVGFAIIACFIIMQVIGELLEFKGKVVPEFLKIRKFFLRRKAEKEEVRLMLQRVEQKLTDVNSHYSADNITRRDNWIKLISEKSDLYGDSIIVINKALAEVTEELKDNTRLTEEMFVQSSRDRIIDFATKVADESTMVSREEYNRIFKVYDKFETIEQPARPEKGHNNSPPLEGGRIALYRVKVRLGRAERRINFYDITS